MFEHLVSWHVALQLRLCPRPPHVRGEPGERYDVVTQVP